MYKNKIQIWKCFVLHTIVILLLCTIVEINRTELLGENSYNKIIREYNSLENFDC